jgi:RNA polymerase sigma-B factor
MAHYPVHTSLPFVERDAATSDLFARLASAGTGNERERIVEQVVHLYLDLCSSIAGRYDGRGIEREDLVQVARLETLERGALNAGS